MSIFENWGASTVEELRKLVAEGRSSGYIAREMGVSRSAIIGKTHRLGIRCTSQPHVRRGEQVKQLRNRVIRDRARPPRVDNNHTGPPQQPTLETLYLRSQAFTIEHGTNGAKPKALLKLKEHECRWPLGEGAELVFCAAPSMAGSSYCQHHAVISWSPLAKSLKGYAK